MRRSRWLLTALLGSAGLVAGCSSGLTLIAPTPPPTYQTLGHAQGRACGSLGLLASAYYFVPLGLNSRVDRAYEQALGSVPGATGLVHVTLREDWYWWLIGTARCVTISGEAIQ